MEFVECPFCGSDHTEKTKNGKFSNGLAMTGAVIGGALFQGLTGIPGILGANVSYRHTWHQFCCKDCGNVFKVRLDTSGYVREVKKYE